MGKCISFNEAVTMYNKAAAERKDKLEELWRLTAELLTYDSKSLGDAVKCYILNEDPGKLNDAPLEAFATIAKIRALEAEC